MFAAQEEGTAARGPLCAAHTCGRRGPRAAAAAVPLREPRPGSTGLRPNRLPCGPRRSGRAPSSAFSSALFFVSAPEMEVMADSVLVVVRPRREGSCSLLLSSDLTIHGSFCSFRGPGKCPLSPERRALAQARSPAGPRPRPPCQVLPGGWGWSCTRQQRGDRTVGRVCPAGDGHARLRLAGPVSVFTGEVRSWLLWFRAFFTSPAWWQKTWKTLKTHSDSRLTSAPALGLKACGGRRARVCGRRSAGDLGRPGAGLLESLVRELPL